MKRRDFVVTSRDVAVHQIHYRRDEVIEWWRCLLLHCMSPFMALFGRDRRVGECLLLRESGSQDCGA
jgi:hypothetical protein